MGVTGLNLSRPDFYEKEISFQVSCSYGPGRYDPVYEEGNVDFPIGYVRWTENRNQQEFLRELSVGAVKVDELAPIRVPIDDAPRAWEILTKPDRPPTVLIDYGRGA